MKFKDLHLGPTGRFPQGASDDTDEGELRIALATDVQQAIVTIHFGKPIAWIGLPSTEARELAALLIQKADDLDRRKT